MNCYDLYKKVYLKKTESKYQRDHQRAKTYLSILKLIESVGMDNDIKKLELQLLIDAKEALDQSINQIQEMISEES